MILSLFWICFKFKFIYYSIFMSIMDCIFMNNRLFYPFSNPRLKYRSTCLSPTLKLSSILNFGAFPKIHFQLLNCWAICSTWFMFTMFSLITSTFVSANSSAIALSTSSTDRRFPSLDIFSIGDLKTGHQILKLDQ